MTIDPLIVQAAISIPIALGMALYTLLRWDRSLLHLMLAALLGVAALWLGASVVKGVGTTPGIRSLALEVELATVVYMPVLCVLTMGYFARLAVLEQNRAATLSLLAVSTFFLALQLTDGSHHLFYSDREAALSGQHPDVWAGPIFWALQLWCLICNVVSVGLCADVVRRGHSRAERGRALMILAAFLAPMLGHLVYVFGLFGLEYSLAPGALGLSAGFFVQGVHRYGLLGGQAIVRHDVIEHLDDGIVLADREGLVLDANAAAEAAFRCTRAELRGRRLSDVLELLDLADDGQPLRQRIATLPIDGGQVSGELRTQDGRWLEVTGGAVTAMGSQPAGRFMSIRDRTVQRRSERLLRERQKLESVGILAAGVAHEVNNPLAYVRANLVHLHSLASELDKHFEARPGRDPGELLEFPDVLAESLEGLDRIAHIVESMLRFSRISDESSRPIDVASVIDEAIRLAALQKGSSVRVERRVAESLPVIKGSSQRLIQVLLNLFLNGKRALADREDGCIGTEATLEGDHVVIRVRDNGPGIPEELQQRIFDPFFTTRGPDEGTGLGLSIAFEIVREHGGTLDVDSNPGKGSCFSIQLPIAAER